MIGVRRASERQHVRRRRQETWHTFDARGGDPMLAGGLGAIEAVDEHRISPGGALPVPPASEASIVIYVREGAVTVEAPRGRDGVVFSGEFHRMPAPYRFRRVPTNASRTDRAHVFQMRLLPRGGTREPGHDQRRFSAADRHGMLCLIASSDGQQGSLRIRQSCRIYSSLLDPGHHVVHELTEGRCAWLHVVRGQVEIHGLVLSAGDGAGFVTERAVSVTAREGAEVLLLDVVQTGRAEGSEHARGGDGAGGRTGGPRPPVHGSRRRPREGHQHRPQQADARRPR